MNLQIKSADTMGLRCKDLVLVVINDYTKCYNINQQPVVHFGPRLRNLEVVGRGIRGLRELAV